LIVGTGRRKLLAEKKAYEMECLEKAKPGGWDHAVLVVSGEASCFDKS
jgi:hypothetical protein